MLSRSGRRPISAALTVASLLLLTGITECNSTCFDYDSRGNRFTYECVVCQDPDSNPCTRDTWNVPAGNVCVAQDQPLLPNGTACDDGTTVGVCVSGVCSSSLSCDVAAALATQTCLMEANEAWQACYANGGAPCSDKDPSIIAALSALEATVSASCSSGEFGSLSVPALVGRLQTSCRYEAASLASRSFGGPHGAAWADADPASRACLEAAHQTGASLLDDVLTSTQNCLTGGNCDAAGLATEVQGLSSTAQQYIAGACSALETIVALDPQQFVERALHQSDCIVATSRADTSPLALSCGPSRVPSTPTRGQYVQIVLDGADWGTSCGDGSPYAFQIRLAPPGQPLNRVLIGMQGGGVCIFGSDCGPIWQSSPGLFEALSDQAPSGGIMSNDPAQNDFAAWTKVFLPYCTQDVYAGGGISQAFTGFDIERYGSVNVRAAVEYVRNLLWLMQDQEGGEGYRPDQMVAAFGGWSAGGFGALYNYHWMLDDLQWPNTTAFADSSLGLDSGDPLFSVRVLGGLLQVLWDALPVFPPYCFAGDCAVGPDLYAATAPRLKATPNQQFLILSNQNDGTQVGTTYFPSTAAWINAARSSVCDTKDLAGVNYYLTSVLNSVHVVSLGSLYAQAVDGELMSQWLWKGVIGAPNAIADRIEEGLFAQQIAGVNPFPCAIAP